MVLAGPVPLVCWLEKRLKLWHATVLAAVALGSVLSINHFAGDYGIQMLYYRNFIGTPMAPGEMVAHFSIRDYISAFRSGMTLVAGSFLLPFLLAGVSGLFGSTRVRAVVGVTMAYVLLHFRTAELGGTVVLRLLSLDGVKRCNRTKRWISRQTSTAGQRRFRGGRRSLRSEIAIFVGRIGWRTADALL